MKSVLACDPDAIVCSSFSKFFGMTGWRLGWVVVPTNARSKRWTTSATNYYLCAHTPTQHAALACFTPETLAVCEERRQELLDRRRIVVDGLKRSVCRWKWNRMARSTPTSTFPALVWTRGRSANVRWMKRISL